MTPSRWRLIRKYRPFWERVFGRRFANVWLDGAWWRWQIYEKTRRTPKRCGGGLAASRSSAKRYATIKLQEEPK